ncbi:MAG TPA: S8/S53 family peptidase [Roseiflexaceae bacterium]|nr:S8/S53 family peptidase [Roseiflexaceae bacterium]
MSTTPTEPRGCLSALADLINSLLGGARQTEPPGLAPVPRVPERALRSFLPGQLCVLAELRSGDPDDQAAIAQQVRRSLLALNIDQSLIVQPERVIALRGRNRTLVAAFADLPALRERPARLLALIDTINRAVQPPTPGGPPFTGGQSEPPFTGQTEPQGAPPTTPLSADAAEAAAAATTPPSRPVQLQLRAASPNWLAGGSQHVGTTGGPGCWPVPAKPGVGVSSETPPWGYTVDPGMIAAPPASRSPRSVEVAILDTTPHPRDLAIAYKRWVTDAEPGQAHPLLEALLGAGGAFGLGLNQRLEVTTAPFDLISAVDADLIAHRYAMADHGLFIAGIIHMLVPAAHLHLVEVLNTYGVGSLETLLLGLQTVAKRKLLSPDTALVINCSLTFACPPPELAAIRRQALQTPDIDTITPDQVQRTSLVFGLVAELIADLSEARDVQIVAAAGNDGLLAGNPHPARYPARYSNVVGVGALTSAGSAAIYSNMADQPSGAGFATFGGDVVAGGPHDPLKASATGVLGVYIGPVPESGPNQTGWARWAGTSFAAPVVSGILARRLASGEAADTAVKALNPNNSATQIGELLGVKQG